MTPAELEASRSDAIDHIQVEDDVSINVTEEMSTAQYDATNEILMQVSCDFFQQF